MNVSGILSQLRSERDRLDQAIAALEHVSRNGVRHQDRPGKAPRRRRRFSAATRKRMSELMKKRWAARKKSGKSKL